MQGRSASETHVRDNRHPITGKTAIHVEITNCGHPLMY